MPPLHIPSSSGGRLGVVIPTLNCKNLLARQLEAMSPWMDLVDEIVVVDSHSQDGTVEFLREHLKHPNVRFILRPRGLYQAWNAGISALETRWTLIATAGDAMSRAGIEHLLGAGQAWDADICLSLPRLLRGDGSPHPGEPADWPLFKVLRQTQAAGPLLLDDALLVRETFAGGAQGLSILGSSASNLYRTELLKACPFPEDAGIVGDVAWGLKYMARGVRVVVTPQVCADFVFHEKEGPVPLLPRLVMVRAAAQGAGLAWQAVEPVAADALKSLSLAESHKHALRRLRKKWRGAWVANPWAWAHLVAFRRSCAKLRRQMADLLESPAGQAWPWHFRMFMDSLRDSRF